MARFVWDEHNQFGVASIDEQHRGLGELVDQLERQLDRHAPLSDLREAFARLYDATERHFRHEEELVAGTGFDRAASHKREHDHLLLIFKRFCQGLDGQAVADNPAQHVIFVRQWLIRHIETEDRLLAAHVLKTAVPAGDI